MMKRSDLLMQKENTMRFDNVCTHLGGPPAEGKLEGYEVQCPWHESRLDIRSGKVARPPAMRSEPTYEIIIEDGRVLVKNVAKPDPELVKDESRKSHH